MSDFELKDSGERREFASGAVRDRGELKSRPDLISPHANLREGMVLTRGGIKYAIRNWEQGIPISECLASAQRHIEQYKRGDRDEDHLAQARCNLGFAIHFEEEIEAGRMDPTVDDMPKYAHHPPCPACRGETDTAFHPELGVADCCSACGWCSLDASPMPDHPEYPTLNEIQDEAPTFYIAGPMRGYKDLNFPAFDAARDRGKQLGYNIVSPADLDRDHGIDPMLDPRLTNYEAENLTQADLDEIVRRDVDTIMALRPERGDGIATLPGWEDSLGARAEVALAEWLGLRVVRAADFVAPGGSL